MMLLLSLPALAAGLAECPRTYDTREIVDVVTSAEDAFARIDKAAFAAARTALESRLPCAKDVLSLPTIARIHRVETLAARLDDRPDRIGFALAGIFSAEPGHQIPTRLVPEGHPIRDGLPAAMSALRGDPGVALPVPNSGWVEVDGALSLQAPTQRASILQQIDDQGAVVATHYRWPDEGGFDWMVAIPLEALAELPQPASHATRGPWGRRAPLLSAAAASLVASGVMYALAADAHAAFEAAPVMESSSSAAEQSAYRSELEALQTRSNGLTWGAYGATALGVSLGIVAVIAW